jgi:hypothetical protein
MASEIIPARWPAGSVATKIAIALPTGLGVWGLSVITRDAVVGVVDGAVGDSSAVGESLDESDEQAAVPMISRRIEAAREMNIR